MDFWEWIFRIIAGIGGFGSIFGIGSAIFIFYWRSRIKQKFDENLERVKSDITIHATKRLKLHDKEYEVLPEIWAHMCDVQESFKLWSLLLNIDVNVINENNDTFKFFADKIGLDQSDKHIIESLEKNGNSKTANLSILMYKSSSKIKKMDKYFYNNKIFISKYIEKEIKKVVRIYETDVLDLFNAINENDLDIEDIKIKVLTLSNKINQQMELFKINVREQLFPEKEV